LIRVGFVAALAAEARALSSKATQNGAPLALDDGSLIAVSGIGPVAAAAAAQALIDSGAGALVSFGLAGGLDPALPAGAIFLPNEVISIDGGRFQTAHAWRERVAGALAEVRPIVCGKLLTSTRIIASVSEKAAAFVETGAVAVDMESLAVAQAAAAHRLPFLTVRVIVDTATDTLPSAVMLSNDASGLHIWRLIRALSAAPADIVGVIRLARRYRIASRSLRTLARNASLRDPQHSDTAA